MTGRIDTIDTIRDTQRISSHASVLDIYSRAIVMAASTVEFDPAVSVALLEDMFSGIDFGMALMDEDLNFVLFNEKYAELAFGDGVFPKIGDNAVALSIKQISTGLYALPQGLEPAAMAAGLADAVRGCLAEIPLERRDGRHLIASSKRTALGGYLVSVSDVTDRKRAEEAEEARWRAVNDVVGSLGEGFSLWDKDLRFMMCNDQYLKDAMPYRSDPPPVGTPGEDAIRESYRSGMTVMPDDMTEQQWVDRFLDWARSHAGAVEIQHTNGRTIIVTSKKTELGGVLITTKDVTEERNSEAKARSMLLDAMENLEEGFALYDEDLRFVSCNQTYVDMTLFYRGSAYEVGTTLEDGARESFRAGVVDLPPEVTEDMMAGDIVSWISGTGEPREFSFNNGRIIRMSAKQTALGGYMVTVLDLTEERNSEAKARDMLLDAFEALDEGLVLCDENMNYVFGNNAWKRMMFTGYEQNIPKPGDSVAENFINHIKSGFYAIPESMTEDEYIGWIMTEMGQHGKNVRYASADGRHFNGSSHRTAFGGSLLFVRDITKQQYAEEQRLAAITDAMQTLSNGIVLYDANMQFVMSNDLHDDFWFRSAGVDKPMPGETLESVLGRLLDADYILLPEGMSKTDYFKELVTATKAFRKGVLLHAKGGTLSANVMQTSLGGYLIEMTDVTDQIALEAELEQQREAAHQNEKLSALGELLAGVAHELNNPLSIVFGYSQMLQGRVADPVLSERVDLICQSSERAAKIVRTFLAMARQKPTTLQSCAVNDILETAVEVSSYSLKTDGTVVEVDLDPTGPLVTGDFDQLAQVFSNLIVNAGHAVRSLGTQGRISMRSIVKADHVVVEIADNGPGIPKENLSRIFEPFFTTKDVGEGTGIGLAFSHRIVESHGGQLSVTSQPGNGATFTVRLERTDAPAEAPVAEVTPPVANTVLVVDDEAGVAKLLSDMLYEDGFDVTTVTDPREALKIAETRTFDVVLSDFKMPQMNGEAFYRSLEIINPTNAARIGFITGDAMSHGVATFLKAVNRPHIEKPILKPELLDLIEKATGGQA